MFSILDRLVGVKEAKADPDEQQAFHPEMPHAQPSKTRAEVEKEGTAPGGSSEEVSWLTKTHSRQLPRHVSVPLQELVRRIPKHLRASGLEGNREVVFLFAKLVPYLVHRQPRVSLSALCKLCPDLFLFATIGPDDDREFIFPWNSLVGQLRPEPSILAEKPAEDPDCYSPAPSEPTAPPNPETEFERMVRERQEAVAALETARAELDALKVSYTIAVHQRDQALKQLELHHPRTR